MKIIAHVLCAALLAGCAGYHIGPVKPRVLSDVKTIAVPIFANKTLVPRIETMVTNAVIKQIQQDGTYAVERPDRADLILQGTIAKIERDAQRSVRGNTLATREFETRLTIDYKLVRRDTQQDLGSRSVEGKTSFFVGGDIQQQEFQALPLAAEDAAVQLVSQISEGW